MKTSTKTKATPCLKRCSPAGTTSSLLIIFALGAFALSHLAQAVSPPPDGAYPGGNTAEGQNALLTLTTGGYNTAVGYLSLRSDTTGGFNTATGAGALLLNTADSNTATGAGALLSNTTAKENAAFGVFALLHNTTGVQNTAIGTYSLLSNTTAGANSTGANTAVGAFALENNTTSGSNTGIGYAALGSVLDHGANTAVGDLAGFHITGGGNIALGFHAGYDLTSGDNNICIGTDLRGVAGDTNTIRIGSNLPSGAGQSACYIGGIQGQSVEPGTLAIVYVDASNKLGIMPSSRRFKHDIKSMDKASESILALNPVTFRYNNDPKNTPCFGLIAEEVAKVDPQLVVRDKKGELLSVRYEQINAMLLNEFLKEHRRVEQQQRKLEKQEGTIARLTEDFQSKLAEQEKQIEALTSGLQKLNAQLEMGQPAPQVARLPARWRILSE